MEQKVNKQQNKEKLNSEKEYFEMPNSLNSNSNQKINYKLEESIKFSPYSLNCEIKSLDKSSSLNSINFQSDMVDMAKEFLENYEQNILKKNLKNFKEKGNFKKKSSLQSSQTENNINKNENINNNNEKLTNPSMKFEKIDSSENNNNNNIKINLNSNNDYKIYEFSKKQKEVNNKDFKYVDYFINKYKNSHEINEDQLKDKFNKDIIDIFFQIQLDKNKDKVINKGEREENYNKNEIDKEKEKGKNIIEKEIENENKKDININPFDLIYVIFTIEFQEFYSKIYNFYCNKNFENIKINEIPFEEKIHEKVFNKKYKLVLNGKIFFQNLRKLKTIELMFKNSFEYSKKKRFFAMSIDKIIKSVEYYIYDYITKNFKENEENFKNYIHEKNIKDNIYDYKFEISLITKIFKHSKNLKIIVAFLKNCQFFRLDFFNKFNVLKHKEKYFISEITKISEKTNTNTNADSFNNTNANAIDNFNLNKNKNNENYYNFYGNYIDKIIDEFYKNNLFISKIPFNISTYQSFFNFNIKIYNKFSKISKKYYSYLKNRLDLSESYINFEKFYINYKEKIKEEITHKKKKKNNDINISTLVNILIKNSELNTSTKTILNLKKDEYEQYQNLIKRQKSKSKYKIIIEEEKTGIFEMIKKNVNDVKESLLKNFFENDNDNDKDNNEQYKDFNKKIMQITNDKITIGKDIVENKNEIIDNNNLNFINNNFNLENKDKLKKNENIVNSLSLIKEKINANLKFNFNKDKDKDKEKGGKLIILK
jgi:hypothetical protein